MHTCIVYLLARMPQGINNIKYHTLATARGGVTWLEEGNDPIRKAEHVNCFPKISNANNPNYPGKNNHLLIHQLAISIIPKSALLHFTGLIQVSREFGKCHSWYKNVFQHIKSNEGIPVQREAD